MDGIGIGGCCLGVDLGGGGLRGVLIGRVGKVEEARIRLTCRRTLSTKTDPMSARQVADFLFLLRTHLILLLQVKHFLERVPPAQAWFALFLGGSHSGYTVTAGGAL